MFGQDRNQMRLFFCEVWRKKNARQPLQPLETIIATVIEQHPEYQALLQEPERAVGLDHSSGSQTTNPFLHMGMHIAISEQISVDRPTGIRTLYQQLNRHFPDQHSAEHAMMEALGEV